MAKQHILQLDLEQAETRTEDRIRHIRTSPMALNGNRRRLYLMEHMKPHPIATGFFTVTTPLPAFKMARTLVRDPRISATKAVPVNVIVNLTIPVGAVVYVPPIEYSQSDPITRIGARKLRASEALVHSIALQSGQPVQWAYSQHDGTFHYVPGATVRPTCTFSLLRNSCASGIHFFIDVRDALTH